MTKLVKVPLKIEQDTLNDNQVLSGFYDEKEKMVVYNVGDSLTDEFVGKLQELIDDPKIDVSELVQISPLVVAVNELQHLKDLEYEPEVDPDDLKKLEESFGIKVSYKPDDENGKPKIWAHRFEIEGELSDTDLAKAQSKLNKLVKDAHNESYQDYKDAKKVLGSFNTSLREAKKTLKAPFQDYLKKVDVMHNLFKGEYDNTYEAINGNFESALAYEDWIKEQRRKKAEAETTAKIEDLSEQNKELADKLEHQQRDVQVAQAFNRIKYTIIGEKHGEILTNKHKWNKDYLIEQLAIHEQINFESILNEADIEDEIYDQFTEEQLDELMKEFVNAHSMWQKVIQDEITTRENAEKLKRYDDGDELPAFAKQEDVAPKPPVDANEDDVFMYYIERVIDAGNYVANVFDEFAQVNFKEEAHAKKQAQVIEQLYPKIADMLSQTSEFMSKHYHKYLEFKNQSND